MEESLNIINTKNKETEDKIKKLLEEEIKKINDKINLNYEQYDKHFNDIMAFLVDVGKRQKK
jgi:ferritin-like protein